MQETVWALLKREYFVRLYRRDRDLATDAEFSAMIEQLCEDVPINVDNILRANRDYVDHYLALGDEQSSDGFCRALAAAPVFASLLCLWRWLAVRQLT